MAIYEGTFAPPPGRFALVAARFNYFVVQHLVDGALDALKRHGVADEAIDLAWVPGSFEIAPVAQRLAASRKYAAVICLGPSFVARRTTTTTWLARLQRE